MVLRIWKGIRPTLNSAHKHSFKHQAAVSHPRTLYQSPRMPSSESVSALTRLKLLRVWASFTAATLSPILALIVFSARRGRNFAMSFHLLPSWLWATARMNSSSSVQGAFVMSGRRSFLHPERSIEATFTPVFGETRVLFLHSPELLSAAVEEPV